MIVTGRSSLCATFNAHVADGFDKRYVPGLKSNVALWSNKLVSTKDQQKVKT